MKNKLLKVLVVLLVASSFLTACGGSENGTNSGAGANVEEGNAGAFDSGQSNMPQYIELSEEEKVSLETMAQFITATKWGEELWGKTITPTDETICNFINRMACENQYYKEGEYSGLLPGGTTDEVYGITYTTDSINAYATEVFGAEVSDIAAAWNWMEGDKCLIMESQYPSGDSAEIMHMEKKDDALIVRGTVAWGTYEELDLKGGGLAFYNSFEFEMHVERNENSPFGYTFISIEYFADTPGTLNSSIDLFKDVLLHPEQYKGFYFYYPSMKDIYFSLADVNGDGVKDLLLASTYREEYQEPGNVFNVLIQKAGKVYDLDKAHHYNNFGKFTLYDTGILKTEMDNEEQNVNFYNLVDGHIWGGRKAVKASDGSTYLVLTDSETDATCEGVLADARYNELTSGEEIELVWYLATEENVNLVFGN